MPQVLLGGPKSFHHTYVMKRILVWYQNRIICVWVETEGLDVKDSKK